MSPFEKHGQTSRISVYTKPGCVQCTATIRALTQAGLEFTAIDATTDVQARDYIMSLAYLQAPVVVAGTIHWSGFRPDRIAQLTDGAA